MNFFKHVKEISPEDEQAIQEAENVASDRATREKVLSRFDNMGTWLGRNSSNRTIVEWLSWVSNFVMAAAAFWGMKIFLEPLGLGSFSLIVAGILLIGLELAKRKLSDSIFDGYFYAKYISVPAVGLLLIIAVGDYWMSYNGAHWGVKDNSEQAKLMGEAGDPEAIAMLDQVKQVDASIAEHRANKNAQGTIYWASQKSIEKLEAQKATLLETLGSKHQTYSIQNEHVVKDWRERIAFQAKTSVYITSFAWVVFFICMAFRSHYDARLARAMTNAKSQPSPAAAASASAAQSNTPPAQQGGVWNTNPILNQGQQQVAQPYTQPGNNQPLYLQPHPMSLVGRLSGGSAAPEAQASGNIPPVATGSNLVATEDEDDDELEIETEALILARGKILSLYQAWYSKTEGNPEVRMGHLTKRAKQLDRYDAKLLEKGIISNPYPKP